MGVKRKLMLPRLRKWLPVIVLISFLLLLTGGEAAELRLLYLNDFHGHAESFRLPGQERLVGGASYLAGAVRRLRREKPTLLLAAGDMIAGHPWADFTKGRNVMELLNALRLTAMVLGNHEFDFGPQILRQRIATARFPVLAANVVGLRSVKPYIVRETAGLKIAIIGVVTPETPWITSPRNVAGLKFLPAPATVARYLPELRKRADLVVVLSHLGYAADRELAARVKGIDVIVGGHSHTPLAQPVRVNGTIIVQAMEHGKAVGVLDLAVTGGKIMAARGYLEEISPEKDQAGEDKAVRALVSRSSRQVNAALGQEIGRSPGDLEAADIRTRETSLGNLVADIIRETAGAEIGLINAGAIRAGISRGTIRLKDIYTALPYPNYLVALRLTGAQVREVLEHGLAALPAGAGRFLQVSGITFTYRPQAPPGQRVTAVFLGDRPLDPEREYVVATTDFLILGGDGFQTFKAAVGLADPSRFQEIIRAAKVVYWGNRPLREIVADYLKKRRLIQPPVTGRIRAVPSEGRPAAAPGQLKRRRQPPAVAGPANFGLRQLVAEVTPAWSVRQVGHHHRPLAMPEKFQGRGVNHGEKVSISFRSCREGVKPPVPQTQVLVSVTQGQGRVMQDRHNSATLLRQAAEQLEQFHLVGQIEMGQGFVQQQHLRLLSQQPGQEHQLALTPGKFGIRPQRQVAKPQEVQGCCGFGIISGSRRQPDPGRPAGHHHLPDGKRKNRLVELRQITQQAGPGGRSCPA